MSGAPEDVAIEYSVLGASDSAAMTKLFGDVFPRRDPPAVAAGLTSAEFEEFVALLSPGAEAEGLTVFARMAGTGELVGALLTEDSVSPPPEGMERLSAKFDPIFDILGQLDADYPVAKPTRPGESLHLFLLGVADRVAGRGVGQRLVAACLENGSRRGYRRARTEATNRVSQRIFRKHGFIERASRSYAAYDFRGRQVFSSIAEHGGPVLMERTLTA